MEEQVDRTISGEDRYAEIVEVYSLAHDHRMQEICPHAVNVRTRDRTSHGTLVSLTKEQAKELAQALLDAVTYLES